MTTVGYGNLLPAANPGQTFAVIGAVTGQLFPVVAVGKIISSMPRARQAIRLLTCWALPIPRSRAGGVSSGRDGLPVNPGVSPRTYNIYSSSREQASAAAERDARVAASVGARPVSVPLADAVT
jgi:hypothetical protein